MKIVGIDPSFTRTGLACVSYEKEVKVIEYLSTSSTESNIYDLSKALYHADALSKKIDNFIKSHSPDLIVIEYPVLATRSGAYLGLIQQALYQVIKPYKNFMVPALAITSISKCKTKTALVNYTKELFDISKINHDEASALVLCQLGHAITTIRIIIHIRLFKTNQNNGKETNLSRYLTDLFC